MKIAALILGILAGIVGFPVAATGHMLVAIGGSGGALLYLLPIASLLGGGLALNIPAAAGALCALSAFFWLVLGAKAGSAINAVTIAPLALNVIAAVLAFSATAQENAASTDVPPQMPMAPVGATLMANGINRPDHRSMLASGSPVNVYQPSYDQARWRALVEFDPEIAATEAQLRGYGQKYIDQFAAGYLVLNDKNYIPAILKKCIASAELDAAELQEMEKRFGHRFSDRNYVLQLAREKVDFFMAAPFGNVVVPKQGDIFLEQNGSLTTMSDVGTLRGVFNNYDEWPHISDADKIVALMQSVGPRIEASKD